MGEQALNTDNIDKIREEVSRLEEEIHKISNKLQNDGFLSRVPAAMIEKEQHKLEKFQQACSELKSRLKQAG
jgi:valyl-tRNA synthetase